MTTDKIEQVINNMSPTEAAVELVEILKRLFSLMEEKKKVALIMKLFGESPSDKIGSMVHR